MLRSSACLLVCALVMVGLVGFFVPPAAADDEVTEPIQINIDVKPSHDANYLNYNMTGWLSVAILDDDEHDFTIEDFDWDTVTLQGVPATEWEEQPALGYLLVKFNAGAVIDTLPKDVVEGEEYILYLQAELSDETQCWGADSVVMLVRSNK